MITISRKLAIINNYVEIPNTYIESKTAITSASAKTAVAGSKFVTINGSRLNSMKFVEFPAFSAYDSPIQDDYATIKSLM